MKKYKLIKATTIKRNIINQRFVLSYIILFNGTEGFDMVGLVKMFEN
jgi:hypothetical protein